jgi:hypothetical protein
MDWFWNWGGECFGYRDGESLMHHALLNGYFCNNIPAAPTNSSI